MATSTHRVSMNSLEDIAFRSGKAMILRGDVWTCRVGRTIWTAAA